MGKKSGQLLTNIAKFGRKNVPLVASQLNIRPVFDVNADVQGRDLASAADEIDKVLAADRAADRFADDGDAQRAGRNDEGKLQRIVLRHGARGGARLSRSRDQFPELD